jgi:integrase
VGEIDKQKGPRAANNTRASLSGYFKWLVEQGHLEANPVTGTKKVTENDPREHVIGYPDDSRKPLVPRAAHGELAKIWRVLDEDQYSSILKLLLLTGTRRDEIAGLRWSEIDFESALIELPGERTKNGREHLVPLVPAAVAILKAQPRRTNADGTPREFVFGNGSCGWQDWSGSKEDLDARIEQRIRPWILHDFRRTMSTVMHGKLKILPHIVEAVLGHVGGHKADVAGVYNKALYLPERRRALESWTAFVLSLTVDKRQKTQRHTHREKAGAKEVTLEG